MGGSLYGAERMPRDKFEEIIKKFLPELRAALGDVEFKVVPYYSEKEDFGDLDIIVKAGTQEVRAAVVKHLGFIPENSKEDHKHQYTTNDNVFSFIYEKFQIDLICTVNNYETSLAYYSYNDVGNILGRFFHKFGLKLGHEGLLYPLRDQYSNTVKEVVVSKDQRQILKFLGLDHKKWNEGFTTLEDIFEWVASGMFFDPTIFQGELSAINERRDRKRKTFSKFLDWIEDQKPIQKYSFLQRYDRSRYTHTIKEFFGCDIDAEFEEFKSKRETESLIRSKFNGDIVMEITGLKGKELGAFMGKFKEHDTDNSFDDYILSTEPELIKQYIKTVFDLQKEKV